ncbi:hypothetical protein [Pontibacillus chungwhensis]|uniref:Small peptidoglycan-associated lipoprotein n=1 Tax=Pontibacillus chungwhensis TaxID=265426 RepID=A0ABY8V2Y4_9BACI|nr:hypothetical protein [Pontibacillus chungwhensis]MCD5322523.1 hypothetical protein [Pontibacillus sp. HN14]WIF99808.1 hypothetical protein QNI29_09160 [Pontibacillus chungwhensis]
MAFVLVLFTGSCTDQKDSSIDIYKMNPKDDFEVFFYSNQSTIELEEEYINALLELKLSRREDTSPITLTKTASTTEAKERKRIQQYPALVIQKEGNTLATVSGKKAKHDILKVLNDSMNTRPPS